MLRIRLARGGTKNKPSYRVVVIEKTKKVAGKEVEVLGYFNPKNKQLDIKKDRCDFWFKKGALPSERVNELLS